jgi:alpha-beta hydrolase superfamily lysophospholipase
MMESCEDIHTNAKLYKKPTLCFIGGKEKIVQNGATRLFLKNCGVPQGDLKIRMYPNSYHNIHQEPEYMYRQRAEIYEFIHHRLSLNPDSFDKN